MFERTDLFPVTIGTSGLGKRELAGDELADALVGSPFPQLDTSNNYAGGESERMLGAAIERAGGLPAGKALFTKVDEDPATRAFDGDRVRRSFEESLERLGLDRVPLLHLHDPYSITVAEAMAPGGAVAALHALKAQGLVDAIGIAAGERALVEAYVRTDAFDAVLTHNRYSLVDRSGETIIELATERGMAVFNAAPFGGGILAGSASRGATYAYRDASPELLAYIRRVHDVCAAAGVEVAAAALQFSLRDQRIHSTVVGVYSTRRLAQLQGLIDAVIPPPVWEQLRTLGTPPPSPAD